MSDKQAEVQTTLHAETLSFLMAEKLVTKDDIVLLKKDMTEFKAEMKNDMAEFKAEIKNDMAEFKAEIKNDITEFKAEIKNDMTMFKAEIKNDMTEFRAEIKSDIADLKFSQGKDIAELQHELSGLSYKINTLIIGLGLVGSLLGISHILGIIFAH